MLFLGITSECVNDLDVGKQYVYIQTIQYTFFIKIPTLNGFQFFDTGGPGMAHGLGKKSYLFLLKSNDVMNSPSDFDISFLIINRSHTQCMGSP